jgi:hypothetical protein
MAPFVTMPFDATAGSATANSYATVAEADAYFELRLYGDPWTDASAAEKQQALVLATTLVDTLPWTGVRTSATQALDWYRQGMLKQDGTALSELVIPAELKTTVFELALYLLRHGSDPSAPSEAAAQNIKRVKAGPTEVEFFQAPEGVIVPANFILPDYIKSILVPSWYTPKKSVAVLRTV